MKFLVPIDFTSNSDNLVRYAAELAQYTNSSLHLLHVITPFVDEDTYLTTDVESVTYAGRTQLERIVEDISNTYKIPVQKTLTKGEVTEAILDIAEAKKIDLIIMGIHNVSPLMKFLFGSTTTSVISKSSAAVLTIPDNISFSPLHHIVYASDYENGDVESLRKLSKLASFFDAEINVVHVTKEYEQSATELSIIEYFSDLIEKHIPYPKIVCRTFKNDNITRGIEIFSQTVGADMIALADRKHGIMDKFLSPSVTKEFVYHGNVPLLVFHQHELELSNEF
ncbi:MAG TPA: universal stress protein [Cyclobacteriaceae bacterium]|nr:universal stress protein [Cyclobacteriaceae bacterium]